MLMIGLHNVMMMPKITLFLYRKPTNANERVPSKYTQKVKVEKYFSVIHESKYTRPASPGTCARYVVVNTEKEIFFCLFHDTT